MNTPMNGSAPLLGCHAKPAAATALRADRPPEMPAPARSDIPAHGGWKQRTSFDRDQLLACSSGELFGVGNAQLPAPPLLLLDRISHISRRGGAHSRGEIVGEFDISPEHWFFSSHFPGDPVMPGCLVLDGLWQLLGFYMAWCGGQGRGRAVGTGEIRMTAPVTPQHRLLVYRVQIKRMIAATPTPLAVADGFVDADGFTVYTAKSLRVALIPDRPAPPLTPRMQAP